jgi:small subunit ribosomal protein S2
VAQQIVRELINAGVHFGHGASRWNPKMAPFIFVKRGNIHIIDIKKTLRGLLIAKKLVAQIVASGKDIVFVGTKRQSQKPVQGAAETCGMHYVSHRWLGGMLTNFRTVRSRLQRLEELEALQAEGSLDSESKKQASRLKRQMRKIKANLDGVRKMTRLPGVVVAVDVSKEYLALREARKLGIATVGIIDTDSDPDAVDVAIPANDDSIRAIELILGELANAVAVGKTMSPAREEVPARARRSRSRRPTLARAHYAQSKAEQGVPQPQQNEPQPEPSEPPQQQDGPPPQQGQIEQPEPEQAAS